jgi:SAM-dependent methyltransferase
MPAGAYVTSPDQANGGRMPAMIPLKEGSKDWWEAKYRSTPDYLYGKAPSPFLTEHIHLMRKGETLDVAMGEGRNAVFLASKGFAVTGVDFCDTAVERAKKLAGGTGVAVEAKLQNLDFFLIPLMKYDTIVVCDFHPALTVLKSLTRGLQKGGTLLLEGYAIDQLRQEKGYHGPEEPHARPPEGRHPSSGRVRHRPAPSGEGIPAGAFRVLQTQRSARDGQGRARHPVQRARSGAARVARAARSTQAAAVISTKRASGPGTGGLPPGAVPEPRPTRPDPRSCGPRPGSCPRPGRTGRTGPRRRP